MKETYILSLDQSTQATKAMIFDQNGALHAKVSIPHRQLVRENGWVEHDLKEILSNVYAALRRVIQMSGVSPDNVMALGISNQRETVAAWNRETGEPVYNAIVWQCSRASELCKGLSEYQDLVRQKTGIPLSPYFSAPKMSWLLQNVPEIRILAQRGQLCLGTMDSFLVWNLSNERSFKTDYSNASRTLLFNITDLTWDETLCNLFGIPKECLPDVCMSDSIYGYTTLGGFLERPIPICGVLGDSHAALLGQNCRTPGQIKATYGTGSSVMMQTGKTIVQKNCGLVTSLAWGLNGQVEYVIEGNLNYTGAVIRWLEDNVGILDDKDGGEELARSANPQDRTYFVPAFTGLGAPYWDSDATALLTGITRTTGKAEIVKACLECIGYQITDLIRLMEKTSGLPPTMLRVDGGPTANGYLMQFQSDMARMEVQVPDMQELSGFGAACAAGFSCGLYDPEKIYQALGYRSYYPVLTLREQQKRYDGWKFAVQQTLYHG